ncbi:hypothetical protein B296_00007597 [Ensete ventricosum]|uniref:Uncharacterized protein n=1 Tax=Ensete ventricosum TaxID=4639 RepID=A0A427AWI9_ENSVE|nr:hypothetical protein B296_00007597 [Ensete ventricosum]
MEEEVVSEEVQETLHGPAGLRRRRRRKRRSPGGRAPGEERLAAERAAEMLVVVEPPVQAPMVEHMPAVPQLPHPLPQTHLAQAHRARRGGVLLLSHQLPVGRDPKPFSHRLGRGAVTGSGIGSFAVFRRRGGGGGGSRPPVVAGKEEPLDHQRQEERSLRKESDQRRAQAAVLHRDAVINLGPDAYPCLGTL